MTITAAAYRASAMHCQTLHQTITLALPVPLVVIRMLSLMARAMGARQGRTQRVVKLRAHYVLPASTLTSLTHPLLMSARRASQASTLPLLDPRIVGPVLLAPCAHSME